MYTNQFAKLWFKLSLDMKHYMEEGLAPTLTESQLTVLEYMMANEQVKASDLIDYLSTTPAAVTTLLDRMEKNQLIERRRCDKDRRIVWLVLTPKGAQEGKRGLQIRETFLDEYLNRISSHNQQLLVYLLGKISNA